MCFGTAGTLLSGSWWVHGKWNEVWRIEVDLLLTDTDNMLHSDQGCLKEYNTNVPPIHGKMSSSYENKTI